MTREELEQEILGLDVVSIRLMERFKLMRDEELAKIEKSDHQGRIAVQNHYDRQLKLIFEGVGNLKSV